MSSISEIFGSNVFNDSVMQQRLPKETYKALQRTIKEGRSLDPKRCYSRRQRDEGLGD